VLLVYFVDDMQRCLRNNSLHAIALAIYAILIYLFAESVSINMALLLRKYFLQI